MSWDSWNPFTWPWSSNPIQANPAPPGAPTSGTSPDGRQILTDTGLPTPYGVDEGTRQALLAQQGGRAGMFADQAQQGYAAYGQQAQGALAALQRQASGQDSLSAEQLRQSLGQQLAQQRSLAAGASPHNAAGAARTAAIQMGRASTAMAGQQATAGLAERQQANTAYGNLLGTVRGQELSAALQSRSNANAGYGAAAGPPQKDWKDYALPAATAAATIIAASDRRLKTNIAPGDGVANTAIGALSRRFAGASPTMSDRALKTNIKPGEDEVNAAINGLRPYTYAYKDQALGAGPQVGVMAQDLQKAGLGQAVVKTPIGLAIDPGKLSGANTAMIAALGRRVAELEGGQPSPPLPSLPTSAAEERYSNSPAGRKQALLSDASKEDPRGVREQESLDSRRAKLQELDLRAAGAYPGPARPLGDPAGGAAQNDLDRRRAVMAALARGAQVAQGGR